MGGATTSTSDGAMHGLLSVALTAEVMVRVGRARDSACMESETDGRGARGVPRGGALLARPRAVSWGRKRLLYGAGVVHAQSSAVGRKE